MDVNTINNNLVEALKSAVRKSQTHRRNEKEEKINTETKELMEKRRKLKNKSDTNLVLLRQLNEDISKAVRKDLRQYNISQIAAVIEANKRLKVLGRK